MDRPVPQPETLWRAAVFERRGNIRQNDRQRTEMNPQVRNLVEDELADNHRPISFRNPADGIALVSERRDACAAACRAEYCNPAIELLPHPFSFRVVRRVRNDFSRMELAEKLDADAP